MPFTFSHPAAILPATLLPKKYYSFTGLIAGSVVPDFEYFIRVSVQSDYSHTFAGLFWFNLPLAIILAWVYHEIVRDPLIGSLPKFFQSRLSQFQALNWAAYFKKNWPIVLVSIVMGAGSHLLWDSFTHESGYFVSSIPGLMREIPILDYQIHICNIIQHGSTIVGGIILLVYIHQLPVSPVEKINKHFGYWCIFIIVTLLVICLKIFTGLEKQHINSLIIAGMSGAMLSLVLTPVLLGQLQKIQR